MKKPYHSRRVKKFLEAQLADLYKHTSRRGKKGKPAKHKYRVETGHLTLAQAIIDECQSADGFDLDRCQTLLREVKCPGSPIFTFPSQLFAGHWLADWQNTFWKSYPKVSVNHLAEGILMTSSLFLGDKDSEIRFRKLSSVLKQEKELEARKDQITQTKDRTMASLKSRIASLGEGAAKNREAIASRNNDNAARYKTDHEYRIKSLEIRKQSLIEMIEKEKQMAESAESQNRQIQQLIDLAKK